MSQITTHVLDTTRGRPAAAVPVSLSRQTEQGWQPLASAATDSNGRITDLLRPDELLPQGCYRLHFDTQAYFHANRERGFYPYVEVVFTLDDDIAHYHIPLLLSAYGYSTYRGS